MTPDGPALLRRWTADNQVWNQSTWALRAVVDFEVSDAADALGMA